MEEKIRFYDSLAAIILEVVPQALATEVINHKFNVDPIIGAACIAVRFYNELYHHVYANDIPEFTAAFDRIRSFSLGKPITIGYIIAHLALITTRALGRVTVKDLSPTYNPEHLREIIRSRVVVSLNAERANTAPNLVGTDEEEEYQADTEVITLACVKEVEDKS